MLEAVNMGARFTKGKYNLLGVTAAFPLATNFDSRSKLVQRALHDNTHPLAKLTTGSLTSALVTCQDGKSIVDQLVRNHKRARAEFEEGSAGDQRPKARRRGGPENRVSNFQ